MQKLFLLSLLIFLVWACDNSSHAYKTHKHLVTDTAMVVSAHPYASKIGVKIMKQGGNAVDALVATNFALAVVYPRAGNLGGGGFMIIRTPEGEATTLDFRETAPAKAHKNLYLDKQGQVVKGLSRNGGLAVGVPGTVAGLYTAWQKYGRIKDWAVLLKPAIDLAEQGFPVSEAEAHRLNKYKNDFLKWNPDNKTFIKDRWLAGDYLVQPNLAKTLKIIAQKGPKGFYEGPVAQAIVKKIVKSGGIINMDDLKQYQTKFRKPIEVSYKNYKVISMPPPSSGGIALGQLLKIVARYPLKKWGFHSYKTSHLMVEAEKRVYADRAKYLGDSDFYPVPVDTLLSEAYLIKRMSDFSMKKATPSTDIFPGQFQFHKESFETTHISIVDSDRMAVSCTTTLNSNYGSKVIVDGYGFFLNNEMDDFSAKPGVPNQFGLIGAEANAIAPHKRMLSSMTPTIVTKDHEVFMVLGTPGGSTIITSVFQSILNVIDFDMNMYDAVQAKRFHHQFLPDYIMFEKNTFSHKVADQLKQAGHQLKQIKYIGIVKAILVKDGQLEGAGDTRNKDDDVEGY